MEWTTELTLEFIKLYENQPVIWDPKHLLHSNRTDVIDAWQKIQSEMSHKCTVADLKRKKDSLMAAFRSLQNKVNDSLHEGNDYKPMWFAYQPMAKFLKNIYQPLRKTAQEPENIQVSEPKIKEEAEEAEETEEAEEKGEVDPLIHQEEEEIFEKSHKQSKYVFQKTYLQPQIFRPIKRNFPQAKNVLNTQDVVECSIHCNKIRKKCVCDEDQCSLYTRLLNTKLRAFDESTREVLMHQIDNMLFQAKFQGHKSPSFSS